MYPLHDKDLDRLSRDAAEHYEMDSGPSGWEQLEKRLDQELPQQRGRRRFLFWLFFIVVSTGSALIGLLINSQPVMPLAANIQAVGPVQHAPATALNNPAKDHSKTNNTVEGKNPAGHTIDKPATDAGAPSADATSKAITHDAPRSNNQESTAGNNVESVPADQVQSSYTNKPVIVSGNNKTGQPRSKPGIRNTSRGNNTLGAPVSTQPFGLNKHRGNKNLVKKQTTINDKPFARNTDLTVTPDKHNNEDAAINQDPVTTPTTGEPSKGANPTTTPNTTKPANATDSSATPAPVVKPKKTKKDQQRGFEFSVVGGPDATTIHSGPASKSGFNVGLQIGYRFSDRWSVNTGVIYTKKYYKADSNYFNPKDYWFSYVKIVGDVKGYCSMLDIPLNVRYDIDFNDKRRFFASAGLSTYYMDKQYYEYKYCYPPSTVEKPKDTLYTDDATYLLSVLNLSVGYERKISRNFSLQAEPYLKIPLKGLGYGNMRMNSYGIFFSLKYIPTSGSKHRILKK